MNIDSARMDRAREQFGYLSWPQPAESSAKDISLRETRLNDQQALRIQEIHAPDFPPITQAIWQLADEELIRADVYHCAGPNEAREMAIRILGEYQSPNMARIDPPPAGEVAFGEPGNTSLLFVRGNLVVQLRNAGSRISTLTDSAVALDTAIK